MSKVHATAAVPRSRSTTVRSSRKNPLAYHGPSACVAAVSR